MRLLHIELLTTRLDEVASFYAHALGLAVDRAERSVTVTAGASTLTFTETVDGTDPFYHFAFNVAPRKMAAARAWLAERGPLLLDSVSGAEQMRFESWDADAVYVNDPAGNIVELIARRGTHAGADPGGPFGPGDILCVSEIGLPLRDPAATVPRLVEQLGIPRYLGSPFALGDEEGLLILPEEGRPWLPERTRTARAFPTRVTLATARSGHVTIDEGPYELVADPWPGG